MKTRHLGTPRVCLRFWVAGPTASEIRKDNSQLPGTPGLFGRGVPGFFLLGFPPAIWHKGRNISSGERFWYVAVQAPASDKLQTFYEKQRTFCNQWRFCAAPRSRVCIRLFPDPFDGTALRIYRGRRSPGPAAAHAAP